MRWKCSLLLVSVFCLWGSAATADTILFANITNSQENPPAVPTTALGAPRPASFGVAFFTLNDAMTSLSFTATVFNIDFTGTQTADPNDNIAAAHIHAGPLVTPTTNGPVVWGFIGTPFNDTNLDTVVSPFPVGVGAMITSKWDAPEGNNTTLLAQLANILEGRSYINFHTFQFPGGEIRGNILAADTAPVPEPGTMTLVGLGGAAILRSIRRRKRLEEA
jgi:CHRD domain-containing protein/PEP-CTERM motif-containing protein